MNTMSKVNEASRIGVQHGYLTLTGGANRFGLGLVAPVDTVTSYLINFVTNIWLLSTVGMGTISNHSQVRSRHWRNQDTLGGSS